MAIISSLYTGVTGLSANGSAMSVIGDNIANANTVGFKASRASFGDILSQSLVGSAGNMQIGRGSMLTGVNSIFTQGSFQTTDSGLDMGIDGDGFFVTKDSNNASYYTRAGQFSINKDGYLVNPEGMRVQGYLASSTGSITGVVGDVSLSSSSIPPVATSGVNITANLDAGSTGLVTDTNNTVVVNGTSYKLTPGFYTGATLATALQNILTPISAGTTVTYNGGTGLLTVNNGATPITINWTNSASTSATLLGFSTAADTVLAAAGSASGATNISSSFVAFNPNNSATYNFSTGITIYDSLGNGHQESLFFRKTGTGWDVYAPGSTSGSTTPVGTLTFNSSGAYTSGSPISAAFSYPGAAALTASITMSSTTQYAAASNIVTQTQNGYPSGSLKSVSIDQTGLMSGLFSNGMTRPVAQVVLANFQNANGLTKNGRNLFTETLDSGQPIIGTPSTGKFGRVLSNSLELSNVDLASEFVKMITFQRGFQANSKIINTSDEMLQDLMSIKR